MTEAEKTLPIGRVGFSSLISIKRLHKEKVELSQDWFVTPTWPRFIVLEHQHGCHDVMCKRCISLFIIRLFIWGHVFLEMKRVDCLATNILSILMRYTGRRADRKRPWAGG